MVKILIADDNQDSLLILGTVLKAGGYHVITALDGVEALEKVRKEAPALVLLDIMMPRMNGLEALQALRQDVLFKDIPIFIVTAKANPESKTQSLEMGATDFLVKPFDPTEALRKIKQYLRDAPSSSSSSSHSHSSE